MGFVKALLRWLESHFPEKLTPEQVEARFDKRLDGIANDIHDLRAFDKACQERIVKLQDEINSLKAQAQLRKPGVKQKFDGTEPWKR